MSASLDLARRAVACKRWRWMPGMLGHAQPAGRFSCRVDDTRRDVHALKGAKALPDLDDPATLGCLLALVREAWGPSVSIVCTDAGWAMRLQGGAVGMPELVQGGGSPWHATEAEALVAALEAAP